MNNRLPHILFAIVLAIITGIICFSAAFGGGPTGSYAAETHTVKIEINTTGFDPDHVVLPGYGKIVWQNQTSQTITITQGWPETQHLPVMASNGSLTAKNLSSLPELRTTQPPQPPQVNQTYTIAAGQAFTVSHYYYGVYAWQILSIPDAHAIVELLPPTPTPTNTPSPTYTPTPTNTPTPWAQGDDDGDRLSNGAETNTGRYVGQSDTGTDPSNPDTDGDGINDGDEVLGTQKGLRLDAMGVSPLKKDILVEIDWFDDDSNSLSPARADCGFHSHKPSAGTLDRLKLVYAEAPVSNPDGSTGVNLIVDIGGGWPFTGGEQIPETDGVLSGEINGEQHAQLKGDYFESNRHGIFHYLLMVHEYRPNPTVLNPSSGLAEVNGDDVLISMGCLVGATYDPSTASTMMHELGHNFGLRHGGPADRCNYKPNHNSIMNYRYQFSGLDSNCDGAGDGLGLAGRSPDSQLSEMMSYSDGSRLNLDENHLDERVGMCGGFIDWNKNFIQNILQAPLDINRYHPAEGSISYAPATEAAECGGEFTTLRNYNEWEQLNFAGVKEDNRRGPAELIHEAPIFDLLSAD